MIIPLTLAEQGGFAALDWAILVLYGIVLLVTGWLFNRHAATDTGEFFLGGRRMPVWAVSISVLATSLSAATFVGGPQQAYTGDLTYLASNFGMVIAALLVAWLLIPRLYRAQVATPYGLLEQRFGTTGRRAAATAFLIGRIMASGARVFIVGIPAALILFGEPASTAANPDGLIPAWQIMLAIGAITVVGIAYTLAGGVRSVIWTDVIQMAVFLTAIIAAIWLLLDRIPGGAATAFETIRDAQAPDGHSKLQVLDLAHNIHEHEFYTRPYSFLACITAFVLMGVASYGTDQDLVQRMLTCKNALRGAWSVISATLVAIPVVALFMIVGLLLFVFYQRPDVMGEAAPTYEVFDSTRIFLSFILRELPAGLGGLMMAGLFAAGLSSLNSGLNSMSSTVVNDFYRHLVPDRTDRHYLLVGRIGVVLWGIVLGGFACLCVLWQRQGGQTLIDFALGVMTFAYAGLLGVFGTVVLTRRGNAASAVASLLVGFIAVLAMNKPVWGMFIDTDAMIEQGPNVLTRLWEFAFVWKLAIASTLAFLVCILGSGKGTANRAG
ncbi:MAG: sodium:solute symporter [Planctomycetota bacterium]